MIAKKILNPKKASPKHVRISRLAAYIRAPERSDTTEKCVYAGARGFHARTPAGQTCEMIALAEDAVRSRDPVTHYVFSWPAGERPTPDQVEEAVTILLDEMAIPDHQAIYGLHADTAHHHLHVLVNRAHPVPRIHPVTGELETRVVKINKGFDIEAAHRAGARIEHAQGWRIEANKRYRIVGVGADGKPVLERTDPEASRRRRQPSQQQIDAELRTGQESVARRVIGLVAPILAAAGGWADWHERLDAHGIRYARKGSGAVFLLDGIAIKASRAERDEALAGDWTGRGASLNRLHQALAALQRAQLDAHREARREARVRHRARWPAFPDYRGWREGAWLAAAGTDRPDPPDRDDPPAQAGSLPADIRAYRARPSATGAGIGYWHPDRPQRADFVETGRRHRILQVDAATVRASLQLLRAKGAKGIRITGQNPAFIRLAIRHALELGLKIRNAELEDQVARERARQIRAAATTIRERHDKIRTGASDRWHLNVAPHPNGGFAYTITDLEHPEDGPVRTRDPEAASRTIAWLHQVEELAGPVTAAHVADARQTIVEIEQDIARGREKSGGG